MLLAILFFLTDFIGPRLSAFLSCNSTRMGLAAITSFLISLFCGPFFITKLHQLKIGQSIRSAPDFLLGELHRQKQDTPTMGGILILFAMLISMFLWMDLTNVFTLILFITTCVLGALGGCDDYLKIKYKNSKGLSARKKMLIQLLLSLFIATYLLAPSASEILHIGHWFSPPTAYETIQRPLFFKTAIPLSEYSAQLYVPFLKTPLCSLTGWLTPLAAFFIFFVITGSSNAVNLTDGLDGLAAGCLIIVATCLAFVAFLSSNITTADYLKILYIEGTGEIAIYLKSRLAILDFRSFVSAFRPRHPLHFPRNQLRLQ